MAQLLLGETTFDLAPSVDQDEFLQAVKNQGSISTAGGYINVDSYVVLPLADGTSITFLASGPRPVAFIG